MNIGKFPKDFIFGSATAAYQIEGAWDKDGKGASIWDTFSHTSGKIANNENGDVACDHYNRYKEDIQLMKNMNLNGYRFSISWPRIFPKGRGEVNKAGLEFYDRLIDGLLAAGIEPCITLYHWDLPQSLSDEGGWPNRGIVDDFVNYASFCFSRFGDRVKKWATFNEAYIVAHLGYETGKFAPGVMDPKKASQASHHLHLAHARTVAAFREKKVKGQIGIVHCLSPLHDMDQTAGSARNASIVDGLWNRWYLDPSLKGRYPADIMDLKIKKGTAPDIVKGDMDIIKNNICDFLGVNFYFRFRVYDTGDRPFNWQECVNSKPFPGAKITEMGWEVYPKGIYELLERINKEYGKFPVYIMENGMAAKDKVLPDGKIEDDDRLEYVKMHLSECKRAIDSGFNLKGYYYWSLMDNFEWTSGYSKRFGLVRVDYDTLKRTVKKSGGWYGEFIKGQKSI